MTTTFHIENDTPTECVKPGRDTNASRIPTPPSQASSSPQIRASVPTDPANEPLQAQAAGAPDSNINAVCYEGFQFFKADPIPGQKATWTRVERTHMHLTQGEFYKMVHKRANKVSAAQQYQNLSDTRRAHVNQLIHEQRRKDPSNEWSCVYAKECDRAAKARNAHRDDYETVSMDIILMKRPMRTKSYPRTPMGDLVDLGMPFRQDTNMPSAVMSSGYQSTQPLVPGQVIGPGYVVQGPLPQPISVTRPFNRLDLGQHATEDQCRGMHGYAAPENNMESRNIGNQSSWSSEEVTSDDSDDESMIFDESQSDASSTTEHPDGMDCECQEGQTTPRQRSCSPSRHESQMTGIGPQPRRKSIGRSMDRKMGRYQPLRYFHAVDTMALKNNLPIKRGRGFGVGTDPNKTWEKKYRIQRIDDEELRSRLLDCEARIEQWERAFENQNRILQKTMKESRQLQRRRSFWDFSSMRHCGCDCPNTDEMGNN